MSWRDCLADIRSAAGRDLTDDEVERIAEAVQIRVAKKRAEGMSPREAAAAAGEELSTTEKIAAMRARWEAHNNQLIRADLDRRVTPGKETEAEFTVLNGRSGGGGYGDGLGVDATHHSLRAQILGPVVAALRSAGLLKAVTSGDRRFNLDVARELYRRKDKSIPGTGNAQAEAAAEILGRSLDAGRAMQNKAGAWIGEAENYMGRQYHEMFKVRGAGKEADFQRWYNAIMPELDHDKTFADTAPGQIDNRMRETWQSLAGGLFDGSDSKGFVGPSNLGKKVSQERSLIFKDADSWFRYNEQFGHGKVTDAIWAAADKAARDTALMQTFGTNPGMMFKDWHDRMARAAQARNDFAALDKLKSNPWQHLFDTVSGRAAIPANANTAYIAATVRNAMQLAHLGQVVFSAIPDLVLASATLRHNGVPVLGGLLNQVRALFPRSEATRAVADSVAAGIDGMVGHMIHRFRSEDGLPGAMSEAINTFHKLNGLTYWTEAQKTGMGLALSHNLAANAGKEFGALDAHMQTSLRRYGIGEAEWDAARGTAQVAADGKHYLLPAHIEDPKLAQKFQTLITDQIREGLTEPTAYAKTLATGGLQSGTAWGEIMRSLTQFKTFTLTMMERQGGALKRTGFDYPGAIYLMAGLTAAGYASMTLRDMINNKTPVQPKDAEGYASLAKDAMVNGGALGLYGDVLLRGHTRSAGDLAASFLGPAPAALFQAISALNNVRQGSPGKTRAHIATAEAAKLVGSNIPNFWATKAATDYLFLHFVTEAINPGAVYRHDKQVRDAGQTYILRP